MWVPLAVLAVLSAVGGLLNLPWAPFNFLDRWLEPVVGPYSAPLPSSGFRYFSAVLVLAVSLVGVAVGLRVWERAARHAELEPTVLRRAWFIDWLYARIIERPGLALSNFSAYVVDQEIIDGAVNGVGGVVRRGGRSLRTLQTGYVRNYALGIAAGTVAILLYVVVVAT